MANREKLKEFHREMILKTAADLFHKYGENMTTMDLIAKEAGYSKTTVYAYFKSKAEIYHTITLKSMEDWQQQIIKELEQQTMLDERYFAICHALADFYQESPLAFKTLVEQIDLNLEDPILAEIYQVGEAINQLVAEVMQEGIKEGLLSAKINIPETLLFLWAAISGIIVMSNEKAEYIGQFTGKSKREFQHNSFQLLLNGLLKEGVND